MDKNAAYIRSYVKPVLTQVTPHFQDGQLCLNAPGMETLRVKTKLDTKEYKDVRYSAFIEPRYL